MKKFLNGFTLAEVLITLGIIGVVARVTLPAVIGSVQKSKTETAFTKAVNTLETANHMIFVTTETASLTAAGIAAAEDLEKEGVKIHQGDMKPYDYLNLIGAFANGTVQNLDIVVNGTSKSQYLLNTKDGIIYTDASDISLDEPYPTSGATTTRLIPDKYDGDYVKILVDVNGKEGPNKLAKDQFVFYIDNYGAVIGYGSKEYVSYARVKKGKSDSDESLWSTQCNSNITPETDKDKAACTGSIVDNDYKIIYSY